MKYLGSKARHADEILSHVLAKRQPGQTYVEPFVGGANVMCRVPNNQGPRIGADINRYMVALHTALANGWVPPESCSKAEYNAIKKNPDAYPPELVAFVATGCSFGSMWFGEYVKNGPGENRCRQSRDSCLRDAPGLAGATFVHSSFDALDIPPNSLVYCDPPYAGTTGYDGAKTKIKVGESSNKNNWNRNKFWRWADALVDAGHSVFVSEYKGPDSSIYEGAPQSDAEKALRAEAAAFQRSDAYTQDKMMDYHARIHDFEVERGKAAELMTHRWQVIWSKEVISDFSASRTTESSGKTETEKLFHRVT